MLRMEIALFLVLAFIAVFYYSAGRRHTPLHRTFSQLLAVLLVHLVFDAATVYTVNHLDQVNDILNRVLHGMFLVSIDTLIFTLFLIILLSQS